VRLIIGCVEEQATYPSAARMSRGKCSLVARGHAATWIGRDPTEMGEIEQEDGKVWGFVQSRETALANGFLSTQPSRLPVFL
jgi:hypothetical protein